MNDHSLLSVKVVPGSSRNSVAGWLGDTLKIRVTAKPEKGKANEAVIALLAEVLGITKDQISISSGHSSPRKRVKIRGISSSEIRERVKSAGG